MSGPVKSDAADEKWEGYPGHTRAKHELVRYYLDIWFRKLGSHNPKLRVFDCFAGRGEYYPKAGQEPIELHNINSPAGFPGSPQLLIDTAVERADIIDEVEFMFIEKERKNAEILRENLPRQSALPANIEYEVVQGKFQEKTPELVRETSGWSGPCFFFLDPFGYKALEYDVVTQLARPDKFEILVNLMAREVVRWQDAAKHHRPLEKLFGTEDWHTELEEHEPEHWNDKEVSYYCKRLRENGSDHTLAYLVTEEDTKAMKYYLVFGTNSKHGLEAMHDSMQNCGVGEYAYAPKRDNLHQAQRGLDSFKEAQRREDLKKQLIDGFACQVLSFDDMVREFIAESEYPSYQRKHIRAAVKALEDEGEITVERITSNTERGLGGKDILRFT